MPLTCGILSCFALRQQLFEEHFVCSGIAITLIDTKRSSSSWKLRWLDTAISSDLLMILRRRKCAICHYTPSTSSRFRDLFTISCFSKVCYHVLCRNGYFFTYDWLVFQQLLSAYIFNLLRYLSCCLFRSQYACSVQLSFELACFRFKFCCLKIGHLNKIQVFLSLHMHYFCCRLCVLVVVADISNEVLQIAFFFQNYWSSTVLTTLMWKIAKVYIYIFILCV